jgi:cold shock CspA family protein
MRVEMYSPGKLYGFCEAPDQRVFFHQEAFQAGRWPDELGPPPILGEEVDVEYPSSEPGSDRAPRASSVVRVTAPCKIVGVVETFHEENGWGFARGDDGESYYLHRSEVEDGRLPLAGMRVFFYRGFKNGRPRACFVRVGG